MERDENNFLFTNIYYVIKNMNILFTFTESQENPNQVNALENATGIIVYFLAN